jgi:DNA-binding response OmpR family regulator
VQVVSLNAQGSKQVPRGNTKDLIKRDKCNELSRHERQEAEAMAATRILVVEDEFLIALDIAGVLEQAGIAVIGPVGNVADALRAIEQDDVQGALLDVHLAGEPVDRIADALMARRIPFAFVSGHGSQQLPAAHRGAPLVKKPFTGRDLLAAVAHF